MKITVLGAGAWGTALGYHLASLKNDVLFYDTKAENESINTEHRNAFFFTDVVLPPTATFTPDLKTALADCEAVVFAVPSKAYKSVATAVDALLDRKVHVLSLAKGFDPTTHRRLSQVLSEAIVPAHRHTVVSLLGPSYAEEVIHDKLTCLSAISEDLSEARLFQSLLSSDRFRVYTNTDQVGAEVAAALKNVIAIAAGILSGLGQGENARAALVTRGNAEILRFGMAQGAKIETFLGLSGIGDLLLTCSSMKSRNFSLGYAIGQRDDARAVLENNRTTVEGVFTSKYVTELAKAYHIDMPICQAVKAVLFDYEKPSRKVADLMQRELKSE